MNDTIAENNFFFGTDPLSMVIVNNQKRIIKVDLRTFKQLYTKLFEGKYLVAMFVFLKRRMEALTKQAKRNTSGSPVRRHASASRWFSLKNTGENSRKSISPTLMPRKESSIDFSKAGSLLQQAKEFDKGRNSLNQSDWAKKVAIAAKKLDQTVTCLKSYHEMMQNIWSVELDTNKDGEITEQRFFKFLRTNRICLDRNLVDEMYKQVLILRKDEQVPKKGSVTKAIFFRLFEKPLMLIPMENAIKFIQQEGVDRPEANTSNDGKTLAVLEFQRNYMKHVFSPDAARLSSEMPTDEKWKETFRNQVVDKQTTIELMARMAVDKYGLTQEQLVKKVQFEIERILAKKRREEAKLRIGGQ
jgi:hypothetical protein